MFQFKFEKPEDRKQWVQVLQARLMEPSLLDRYARFNQENLYLHQRLPPLLHTSSTSLLH